MNRHLGLFLFTVVTSTAAGARQYAGFQHDFGPHAVLHWWQLALGGLYFSVPFLGFLTAHEFGHYGMARWHGLRPSLPYYIPAPHQLVPTGSLGAVIVFRGQFPNRRVLFDFAAGGPIAGFVVAVLATAVGLHWSPIVAGPVAGEPLGAPLVFQWISDAVLGPIRTGHDVSLHPTAFAGWLGLLFTMMNLVPISQLDGGHIIYAAVGRHSGWVTIAAIAALTWAVFGLGAINWLLWLVLLLVMMRLIGWKHPPSLDDDLPLDPVRLVLVGAVIAIMVVCFVPVPFPGMKFFWW
jgi:membrane-associated protease RseP (regulator of RpoE activity)